MDLDIGQADRLAVARGAHRPDAARGIRGQGSSSLRPSAQPAQGIQPTVDRGGPSPGSDHVLAVGDELVLGEPLEGEGAVLDGAVPSEEMTQIVAIAAPGRRCQVVARQAGEEGRHPSCLARRSRLRHMYCTQSHPPR